jgi:hypothetical protein
VHGRAREIKVGHLQDQLSIGRNVPREATVDEEVSGTFLILGPYGVPDVGGRRRIFHERPADRDKMANSMGEDHQYLMLPLSWRSGFMMIAVSTDAQPCI